MKETKETKENTTKDIPLVLRDECRMRVGV